MTGGHGEGHWFAPVAEHLGEAYLRYSFTRGTRQEVDFLVEVLELEPPMRVLDVGCGPGRHARVLAERGFEVVGVDISPRFVEIARRDAPPGLTVVCADARTIDEVGSFDAAISLCQGAFGISSAAQVSADDVIAGDATILTAMARSLRRSGRLAVSAFSAYFQVRDLTEGHGFDASTGVHHEEPEMIGQDGSVRTFDLWTACLTPRELRLLAADAGLAVDEIWSVTPGRYGRRPPSIDEPEFLLTARPR
ncbi:MAG: class I SAM-dependent methyltransferase [Acidimicrobiales bacterium]